MSDETDRASGHSHIAVVGMAGRFPGARNVSEFWANLRDGVESVKFFTDEELLAAGETRESLCDPAYVKACPVLDDIDQYDAGFFGHSPRDAAIMDPQHRFFLETAWEALESAGYVGETYPGSVGVFATCGMNSYMMHHLVTNREVMETIGEWLVRHTGNDMNFLATRVSYELNLAGPSMNVQTACSSALVAIHVAAQSLLSGECDLALAGGSAMSLPQDRGYIYTEGEILSPDGHCRAFDARARGTLFGSGTGCVVLKRLVDALADGDEVLAVLLGSAVNNDGSAKVGYLAPSVEGQAKVVAEALAIAGVGPETISYVEAHGTGTRIGDPIEVTALTQAYRAATSKVGYCAIGSTKPNIGHLGEAAGVAGFIKTVLALTHAELPPSLNYETPNPEIDLASTPFYVNTRRCAWRTAGGPRRAGVTALGAGGTNVHAILEEAPPAEPSGPSRPSALLVLSARTRTALESATTNLARHLRENPQQKLADVAYTLQLGRKPFAHRRTLVCRDHDDAILALSAIDPERVTSGCHKEGLPSVVFMFPGGGAQYARMGAELYASEAVYRQVIDACARSIRPTLGLDLRALLLPERADLEVAERRLERPSIALPALFATSLATARLLMSWGIEPTAMIGHSVGEYVAACLAGVVSPEDGMGLVALRGRLFETLPEGAMLSVALTPEDARAQLGADLSLAAINAPGLCVVSGPARSIAAMEEALRGREVECARIHIDIAAHSPMLEPILGEFERYCRGVRFKAPTRRYVSNLTGTWITEGDVVDPTYWVKHLRSTVCFADGLATILEQPGRVLIEVGPGRTLSSLGRQQPRKAVTSLSTLRHPKEEASDVSFLLGTIGKLWLSGVAVDWKGLHDGEHRRRVPLPTYPFERQRFWIERGDAPSAPKERRPSLAKQADLADWFHLPSWRRSILPTSRPQGATKPVYVVFADSVGLAARLVRRLEARVIVTVVPGRAFGRTGEHAYTVAPGERADYDALVADLATRGIMPQRIVHLWAVTAERPAWAVLTRRPSSRLSAFDGGQVFYFYSLLFLAQALAVHTDPIELTIVSSNLQQIAGEAPRCAEKATLLGPCLVIPRELPNVATRSVDVVLPARGSWQEERLLGQLAGELAVPPVDKVCAYRGADRWVQTFEAARLGPAEASWVRPQGVYLITGGLGGIGLELAEHMAQAAHVKLVLVGRTALPPRSMWGSFLAAHGAEDATSRKILKLEAIEALGSEVMLASANIAEREQMQKVVADVKKRFGAIRGVVHAAGKLDDVLMALRPPEAVSEVIATKVKGALVLDAVLRRTHLDFFVVFSSVSSILGLPGQVDYTAANAFLDAFAQEVAAREGTRAVSINWSAWREVGMAAALSTHPARLPALAMQPGVHPLLERWTVVEDGVVFSTDFSREKQWLIAEHAVRGAESLMPGTGYLELARTALELARTTLAQAPSARAIEFRDVLFLTPFVVPRSETKELRVRLSCVSNEFVVWSQSETEPHVTGRVAYVDVPPARTHDVGAIAERCSARDERIDGFLPQSFMDFGPRWGNVRRIRRGRGEALLTLELPEVLAGDLAHYRLHPALLDMATGGAQTLLPGFDPERHFYVPFSYGRLLVRGSLPARLMSHVRLHEGGAKDLAVFDVTILDEGGGAVVEITDFAMRRVADRRAMADGPPPKTGASSTVNRRANPGPHAWSASLREAALREGISTVEGLAALDRILAHGGPPQIVASSIDLHTWAKSVAADARPVSASEIAQAGIATAPSRANVGVPYLAPRNEIELELAGYWRELLGVEEAGVHDDFFELGGQSLVAVRLFNKIRKKYGVDLPLSTLFDAPSIARCAEVLHAEFGIPAKELRGAGSAAAGSNGDARQMSSLPPASRWSSLVSMQPNGTRPPFYCVAGMGGNLANLRRLALLVGDGQPFYGLQPPGLDGKQKRLHRVEELAAHYLEEILAVQSEGPFLLGGYSGGGVAAFEMSCQLLEMGHEVAFLGFLDSFSPALPRRSYVARAKIHASRTAAGGAAYLIDLAGRRLGYERREALRRVTRVLGKAFPERYRYANIGDSWMTAERAYTPGTFDGAATLFRAAEESALSLSSAFEIDEQHGWGRFVSGGVHVELCPGNHTSMCEEPNVGVLATRLRASLDRAGGRLAAAPNSMATDEAYTK
jgi:acyl transferase domain-containing protein/thioesterase domain-containing protein